MRYSSLSTELEALTGASGHLQFASETMDRSVLSAVTKTDLLDQMESIRQRLTDPALHLAVIGEFSSGKSTFINGLLRDELLKTSALVATAAATRLRSDPEISVEVKLTGAKHGLLKTRPDSQHISVPWLPAINGVNNRQLIHLVTADQSVAAQVSEVTITHPARFLADGITIIDTPGTNASQISHAAITRKIVEQEADAAIVIIPATVPLSQSLSDFLLDSLHPYLHRCIFVVSRMDQIRPSEQATLLADVQSRLASQIGIKSPVLHACAAQVLLDELAGEPVPAQLQSWKNQFEQLEAAILQRLRQERSLNIAERLLRLLSQLFIKLDHSLQSQLAVYQQRQDKIQQEIIPDLASFIAQQQQQGRQKIRDAVSRTLPQVASCIEKHRSKTIGSLQKKLFATSEVEALNSFISNESRSLLESNQASLTAELQQIEASLSSVSVQVNSEFDQLFISAYRRLQTLTCEPMAEAVTCMEIQSDCGQPFASSQSLSAEISSNAAGWRATGFGSGAAIGTLIFPVAGTLIGGVIGFGLSLIANPSLNDRQQRLWQTLHPELNAYYDRIKEQAQATTELHGQQITSALNKRIAQYSQHYQETVDSIHKEQQIELATLNEQHRQVTADLQEIRSRQTALTKQQQRLSTK
jgi:gas vesicle protein/predicted GTPase